MAPSLIPRLRPTLTTVESTLCDLTVVTWSVAPERLRRHVPSRLSLEVVGGRALLSAVTFQNRGFSPHWLPAGLTLGQTNYRVYVRDGDQRAVFFLGSTLDTVLVFVPRWLWGMPWRRARYRFSAGSVSASGVWPLRLSYRLGGPVAALDGFASLDVGLSVLTQPWVGLYARPGGRLGRYTIWHAPYEACQAVVQEAWFPLLDQLQIVPLAVQSEVHSALHVSRSLYHVHLPPRPLA